MPYFRTVIVQPFSFQSISDKGFQVIYIEEIFIDNFFSLIILLQENNLTPFIMLLRFYHSFIVNRI